jgi:hypothetical protein
MANNQETRVNVAVGIIFLIMLFCGCAGSPTTQQMVVSEYMLQNAGFQKWDVNEETPKRAALMNNIPKGQITTFTSNGTVYHVYSDEQSKTLYVGDAAAYQKYLSMAHGQNICQRVEGSNNSQFWSCFDEYQQRRQQGLER